MYRQGDVLLKPVTDRPAQMREFRNWHTEGHNIEATPEGIILARGEVTGHKHLLKGGKLMVEQHPEPSPPTVDEANWRSRFGVGQFTAASTPQRVLIKLDAPTTLVHEEHGTIEVPAGLYELVHQREYEPQSATRDRVVMD